jgi:hypothetical protein
VPVVPLEAVGVMAEDDEEAGLTEIPHACSSTVGGLLNAAVEGPVLVDEVQNEAISVVVEGLDDGTAAAAVVAGMRVTTGFWIWPSPICDTGAIVIVMVCIPPWTWPSPI